MTVLELPHLLELLLRKYALHTPDVDDEGEGVDGGLDDGGVECSGLQYVFVKKLRLQKMRLA